MDRNEARTDVKTEVAFLGKLVERVIEGKLRIPRFQRPFVWAHDDMLSLLESVWKGFPIGSILVWDTAHEVSSHGKVGPIPIDSPPDGGIVSYLLDGQQRVSTLVGCLQLGDGKEQSGEPVNWEVYFDLADKEFVHAPRKGLEPKHFPVRSLLSTTRFLEACRAIQDEVPAPAARDLVAQADRLANSFRTYQVPVITIHDAELDTAVAVFARLNRRGRRISPDQMVSALTYRDGEFSLSDELDKLQTELSMWGFGDLNRVFILRAVLAAMNRDIYAKDWTDLMVQDDVRRSLPRDFDRAAEGIRGALGFLKELGVTSDRLLPYGLQLVLLAEFFRICPDPSPEVLGLLERWFWVSSFTGWFGGVNTARARQALTEMRELARGERTTLDVVDLDAPANPFPTRFDGRSARVRAFLLFLASLQPLSLKEAGVTLDPGRLLTEQGPRAAGYLLSSSRLVGEDISSPANRLFVDFGLRGQAITHLEALDPGRLKEILSTHGFPDSAVDLVMSRDRAALLNARREHLIDAEREFLRGRGVKPSPRREGDVVRDSDSTDADDE